MSMKTITIRIPAKLKEELDNTLDQLNISQTELFINTAKYVVSNKKLPFIMVEKFVAPADIYQKLVTKLVRVDVLTKELELINDENLNQAIEIIQQYLNFYNAIRYNIIDYLSDKAFNELQSAFNHACTLSLALDHTTFDNEGTPNFPPDFNRHVEWFQAAFDNVIKASPIPVGVVKDNVNVTIRDEAHLLWQEENPYRNLNKKLNLGNR